MGRLCNSGECLLIQLIGKFVSLVYRSATIRLIGINSGMRYARILVILIDNALPRQ